MDATRVDCAVRPGVLGTRSHPDERSAVSSVTVAPRAPAFSVDAHGASSPFGRFRFSPTDAGARVAAPHRERHSGGMMTTRSAHIAGAAAALTAIAAVLAPIPASAQVAATGASAYVAVDPPPVHMEHATSASGWAWPVAHERIIAPFVAPAHEYGPGHRGIDLASDVGADVRSPAAGIVAFAGSVAGRGIVTIDHGDGLVTTLEPVAAGLAIGTVVDRGTVVATVATGGHTPTGAVHFGVREDGEYINPMLLLGGVERAVLLPCC